MTIKAAEGIDTVMLSPQTLADGASVSARLDTNGAMWATIRLNLAIEETTDATNVAISLLHSDDTVVSNFATLRADLSQAATVANVVRYEVDLRGRKRWLRLVYTGGTGTGSISAIASIATLHRNRVAPATTEALTESDSGGTDVYFP